MAKYFVPCDSFADVERLYNSVTPVRKRDKLLRDFPQFMDLRPTNCRSRQWERVIKVSKNKYILHDGEELWGWNLPPEAREEYKAWLQTAEETAPILWERKRDGSEILTIRNMSAYSNRWIGLPIGRVDFLDRHLPRGWRVYSYNGNQYINASVPYYNPKGVNSLGVLVLPRNTFMSKRRYAQLNFCDNTTAWQYNNAQTQRDTCLKLKRTPDNQWHNIGREYGERKWRIDKETKAKYRQTFRKFGELAIPLMAMLADNAFYKDADVASLTEATKELNGVDPHDWSSYSFERSHKLGEPIVNFALEIMNDPEHEHMLGLVKVIQSWINDHSAYSTTQLNYQARYNDWVNMFFGFKRKVEV